MLTLDTIRTAIFSAFIYIFILSTFGFVHWSIPLFYDVIINPPLSLIFWICSFWSFFMMLSTKTKPLSISLSFKCETMWGRWLGSHAVAKNHITIINIIKVITLMIHVFETEISFPSQSSHGLEYATTDSLTPLHPSSLMWQPPATPIILHMLCFVILALSLHICHKPLLIPLPPCPPQDVTWPAQLTGKGIELSNSVTWVSLTQFLTSEPCLILI